MKKTIGLIVLLLFTLITLSGCAQVNYEIEINKNGTGTIYCSYEMSKKELGEKVHLLQSVAESMKEKVTENGYTVELYEDDDVKGFRGSKTLNDITKDFSLEEVFEVFENFGKKYVEDTEENGIKIEKTLFKTKYSQKAVVDLTDIETGINMQYAIKLPAKSITNNATKVSEDGRTLTWEIEIRKINNIEFVSEQINLLPIIIIVIVAIIILIMVIIVIIILKKKHTTNKE